MESCCTTAGMTAGTTRTPAMPIEANATRKNIGSPRHQSHEPRVFCVIATNALPDCVKRIIERIRRDEEVYGSAGTYLYVRPDGTAHLVREELTCSQRWVKEHFAWLVGFYTRLPNPKKGLSLEAQGMAEDIAEHLGGYNSAADGRQCVGLQQTGEGNGLQPATGVAALQRSEAAATAEGDILSPGGGASTTGAEE